MDPATSTTVVPSEERDEARVLGQFATGRFYYDKDRQKVLLHEFIDKGAFGKVFRATRNGTEMAVKIVNIYDQKRRRDALLEAKILAEFSWSGWSPIFFGSTEFSGCMSLEMGLLGPSLRKINDNRGITFSCSEMFTLAQDLLSALDCVHGMGYVHADVKPLNICLRGPNTKSIVLVDFGGVYKISRLATWPKGDALTTLPYESPEALFGLPLSTKVDVWSAGITLAEMLIGKMLFIPMNKNQLCREFTSAKLVPEAARESPIFESLSLPSSVRFDSSTHITDISTYLIERIKGKEEWTSLKKKEFVDIICQLLTPDSSTRPSARNVLDTSLSYV